MTSWTRIAKNEKAVTIFVKTAFLLLRIVSFSLSYLVGSSLDHDKNDASGINEQRQLTTDAVDKEYNREHNEQNPSSRFRGFGNEKQDGGERFGDCEYQEVRTHRDNNAPGVSPQHSADTLKKNDNPKRHSKDGKCSSEGLSVHRVVLVSVCFLRRAFFVLTPAAWRSGATSFLIPFSLSKLSVRHE